MTAPDPVTEVWELLWTAACDYRDAAGPDRSEARLVDALMPIVTAYGDERVERAFEQRERAARAFRGGDVVTGVAAIHVHGVGQPCNAKCSPATTEEPT